MSVYKPKGKPFYLYDFKFRGHRFHGTTGCSNRRDAEAAEEREKARARQVATIKDRVTVKHAIAHYMVNRGQHARIAGRMEVQYAFLAKELGPDRYLDEIATADVMAIVAKRRADVSDSTVNRSVTQPLRRVWLLAEKTWRGSTGNGIDWPALTLREPQERVREITDDEEAAITAVIRSDALPLFRWSLLTGMRKAECLGLRWRDVDLKARRLTVHGKGDKKRTLPLSRPMLAVLTQCRHHLVYVFTFAKFYARDGRRGERVPMTEPALRAIWENALDDAGITDLRWHDIRHTAATRMLRRSGNLALVQKLLGHDRVTTTMKYAHTSVDDLLAAMESVENSRPKDRPALVGTGKNDGDSV